MKKISSLGGLLFRRLAITQSPRITKCLSLFSICTVFVFAACDDGENPSSFSRLDKIIYEDVDDGTMITQFKYDRDGKLTGFTTPYIGPDCQVKLTYNDDDRVVARDRHCGALPVSPETNYSYPNDHTASLVVHAASGDVQQTYYYNDAHEIDSIYSSWDGSSEIFINNYVDGNLMGSVQTTYGNWPGEFIITEVSYDQAYNPHDMLKTSAGRMGFEVYGFFGVGRLSFVTRNNLVRLKTIQREWLSDDDHTVLSETIHVYEFDIEYYDGGQYPKTITTILDGVQYGVPYTYKYK